ncbi:MAG: sigma-54-dependent Fis family transcriptional regulator [Spirochaetes bacterium]|nr:sigma-54-dependent Fis family transcriptional regulator [Spirochaetota bacterium]
MNQLTYNELLVLNHITTTVLQEDNLKNAIQQILLMIQRELKFQKGVISIYDRQKQEVFHEAYDHEIDQDKLSYLPGEEITGEVFETGMPIIIPNLEKDFAFICVPIQIRKVIYGTLSVHFENIEGKNDFSHELIILNQISLIIGEVVKKIADQQEIADLREQIDHPFKSQHIIGNSSKMKFVLEQIQTVAKSSISVLITGETGTGKELVASEIHYSSKQKEKPFITVNCGALPEGVIESELFGHKKGAFTGAIDNRMGKFEAANGGTIFLDEIGELSLSLQVKLLRVLQSKEVIRLGENQVRKIDVRIITATNKDLEKEIAKGNFRADLYYRLNVFHIYLPALRERGADIILLADLFIQKFSVQLKKDIKRLDTPSIDMLMSYHWPGNVRELENVIERACLLSFSETEVTPEDLPDELTRDPSSDGGSGATGGLPSLAGVSLAELEKQAIIETLALCKGNKAEASRLLGITEKSVYNKLKKYGL